VATISAKECTNRVTLTGTGVDTVQLAAAPRFVQVLNLDGTADLTVTWLSLDYGTVSPLPPDPVAGAVDNRFVPPAGSIILGPFARNGASIVKVRGSGNVYAVEAVEVEDVEP
jgi:hypothetical protein